MNIKEINLEENSKFLKLIEGENVIRIVSDFVYEEVEYPNGNTGTRYTCFVIDRSTGKIKIAGFGKQIIKQIQALAHSSEYGFDSLPKYDMTIVRVGSGLETDYTVRPARQDTELTDEEIQLVAALPPIDKVVSKEINVSDIPF